MLQSNHSSDNIVSKKIKLHERVNFEQIRCNKFVIMKKIDDKRTKSKDTCYLRYDNT